MMLSGKKLLSVDEAPALLHPGSVLLLGTLQPDGRPNIMALAWYTLLEGHPLQLACVVRNDRESHQALAEHRECVLNIPTADQLEQVLACGSLSAREIDKLAILGWNTCPASRVSVPLISESPSHVECQVVEQRAMGDCSIFVLQPVAVWVDEDADLPDAHAVPGALLLRATRDVEHRKQELRSRVDHCCTRVPADPLTRALLN